MTKKPEINKVEHWRYARNEWNINLCKETTVLPCPELCNIVLKAQCVQNLTTWNILQAPNQTCSATTNMTIIKCKTFVQEKNNNIFGVAYAC